MEKLQSIFDNFQRRSNLRFSAFEIESAVGNLEKIQDGAYLEKSKWLGGSSENFVCLAIDLDKSSKLSARKDPEAMARLYEYFTQNIVEMLSVDSLKADYIDIKGDGVFGIYQEPNAIERAFVAAVTFRTFFEKVIKGRFPRIQLTCKSSMCIDSLLVKKIGNRKYNNEVWAGRLVNNTYKLIGVSRKAKDTNLASETDSLFAISSDVYKYLDKNYHDYAVMSCGCHTQDKQPTMLWSSLDVSRDDDIVGNTAYFLKSIWCDNHGDEYIKNILGIKGYEE